MEGVESAKVEQMGEDMMNNMMKEFEQLGEKVGTHIVLSVLIQCLSCLLPTQLTPLYLSFFYLFLTHLFDFK